MSHVARKQDRLENVDSSNPALSASTRVDAPHVAGDPAPPQAVAAMAGSESGVDLRGQDHPGAGHHGAAAGDFADETSGAVQIVQQVRAQAAQLAGHLRRQQATIDHRESELNARVGAMEAQFRSARLWLTERQQEFAEMRAELDVRERSLEARAAEIAGADAAVQTLRASTEQELRQREAALETREAVLATRLAEMTESHAAVKANWSETQDHFKKQELALAEREMALNSTLALCIEREKELDQRQLALNADLERLTDLDRRQTELESRAAEIAATEAAGQTARQNSEDELRRREAALQTRETVLATRLTEVVGNRKSTKVAWAEAEEQFRQQESAFANREAELNEAKAACIKREQELVRRQEALNAERARFADQAARGERSDDTDQRWAELRARGKQLDAAESLLTQEQGDLQRTREAFYAEQTRWQEELASARHKLREDRQQFARDVEKKKLSLRRRRDDLDSRRTGIKQLSSEVSRTQRETLEMRLATEELWTRLCGTMAPATLTQSLGQLRLKLADQNRLAQAELGQQRAELQGLSARLAEQHERLLAHRKELQSWAMRRTAEVEQQAALLVAREQELDRQESEMRQISRRHHDERRSYQQEIRKLMRQLREPDSIAATA